MRDICEILGTRYPVMMGALGALSNPELVAAVSEAGAYGLIATVSMNREEAEMAIDSVMDLTEEPFGINIVAMNPNGPELVDLCAEKGIRAVTVSAGSPKVLAPLIAEAGIALFQVIPSPVIAQKAVAAGAVGVVAEGGESGGMQSPDAITTINLIPQVADAVEVPVVAAGGIYDARGYAAAFALGASGVQLGTRLMLTDECCAHPDYKRALLEAGPTDTTVLSMNVAPVRALKNEFTESLKEMGDAEAAEAVTVAWMDFTRTSVEGPAGKSLLMAGECAGAIDRILPAGEVIRLIAEEGKRLLGSEG